MCIEGYLSAWGVAFSSLKVVEQFGRIGRLVLCRYAVIVRMIECFLRKSRFYSDLYLFNLKKLFVSFFRLTHTHTHK